MKILFLISHGFSESSGISKKIRYQIKGFRSLGHTVHVCTYDVDENNHRVRRINEEIIADYGVGKWGAIKKRISYNCIYQYAIKNEIDFIYVRSYHNANPFTIHLFRKLRKAGIYIALEIPTYPYDQEYEGFPLSAHINLQIDKLFRLQLARQTNAIVTFSNYTTIFGQRTIRISNGVDFDEVPLYRPLTHSHRELHLIGVAEVHYWHGFDRLIHGLGEYYQSQPEIEVYFHIVGGIGPSEMYNSRHAPGFHELINQYGIEKYVLFHGQKFGQELDELFDHSDFAIGSLARHRCYIDKIKTLKNREYAARGIPFIYSETDDDFEKMPYIIKAPTDNSYIDIRQIIYFYQNFQMKPQEIRNSIFNLSWKEQMNEVIKQLTNQ